MNSLRILSLIGIVASAGVLTETTASAAPVAAKPNESVATGPEVRLKRGMPAAEVKAIMGTPQSVQAMQAPSGKAEVWVYRRRLPERIEQVLVGTKPITYSQMSGDGKMREMTIAEEPIYKMQRTVSEDVVSILMFNDHFLEKKVMREVQRRFE